MALTVDIVDRLLAKFGRSATLRFESTTPEDVNKPWDGEEDSPTNTVVTAVFLDYELDEIDGTIVKHGDKKAFVSGSVSNAEFADRLIDGSFDYHIQHVSILDPGPTRYLYEFGLRK